MLVRDYVIVLSVLICSNGMAKADVHLESGEQQQIMMELYTSEGCSSCPPAEKYLNNFYNNSRLWKPFIPLAFHVDYWDKLGWQDMYARPDYSKRQRDYAKKLGARTIYTPEFFVNGKEWRPGFYTRLPQLNRDIVGNLQVDVNGQSLTAVFFPVQADMGKSQLNIALLGMNLHSHIRAGENAGRIATHQFVVLAQKTIHSDSNTWETTLPQFQQGATTNTQAVVVWVSEPGSPVPVQAVGGFLTREDKP